MAIISFWDPMVEKISKCLDIWKGAYFSLGDQITFIQACLSGIPLYLSLFRLPIGVANTIEKIEGLPLVRCFRYKL